MKRTALVGVLAGALVLAGCTSTPETPTSGGDLVVGFSEGMANLDPLAANAVEVGTDVVSKNVFDTLVVTTDQGITPSLAESWESPDDTTWIFTLRDGVTFHDGSALTSDDVKASIEYARDSEGTLASLWSTVVAIETPSDLEVRIETSAPVGALLSNLSLLDIAKADQIGTDELGLAPLGTGPYSLESFEPAQEAVLVKYDGYWGEAAQTDTLTFRVIPEASSRLTALTTGEVDLIWSLQPEQIAEVESDPSLTLESVPGILYNFVWFNHGKDPYGDVGVRQALWHAVNWQEIIDTLYPGIAEIATAATTPATFGYKSQTPYTYDPELAKDLLAEAGYPDGFSTSIDFNPSIPAADLLVQAMVSSWAEVGVQVEIRPKERTVWVEDLLALNWDLNLGRTGATNFDAASDLGRFYTCEAERIGLCDDRLTDLLNRAGSSIDPAEREDLYGQAGDILWDEAIGIFPMFTQATYVWRTDSLQNVPLDAGFVPRLSGVTVTAD